MRIPMRINASSESPINIAISRFDLFLFLELLLRTAVDDLPIDLVVASALIPVTKESDATGATATGVGGSCGELGDDGDVVF